MRTFWLILSGLCLAGCFAALGFDFWRFFASDGAHSYLSLADLWPTAFSTKIQEWAALEGATWGNIARVALVPILLRQPLWIALLIFSVVFRLAGRKPE